MVQLVKKLLVNAEDTGNVGSISGLGRSPGGENDYPLQNSCLGNPMDRRSLEGYSPWGCKRVGHNLATKQQQCSGL